MLSFIYIASFKDKNIAKYLMVKYRFNAVMKNYFIDNHTAGFTGGPTHFRRWTPLDILNSISLLRHEGLWAELISANKALTLNPGERPRFFITTSAIDLWQCPPLHISEKFFALCRKLALSGDLYVWGYHPTLLPQLILEQTGARAVIKGEPEETIKQICNNQHLDQIRGITFIRDGKTIHNPEQLPLDLSSLPVPAYDQINFNDYQYQLMGWNRFALFETSRGCKYECDFCGKNVMYGQGFRQKATDQVKKEILTAVTEYGVKTGYFFDLDFLSAKPMVRQICDYLIKEQFDFRWCCQTRVNEVDKDILMIMADAGCRLIHFGIESHRHLLGGAKYHSYTAEKLKETIKLTESMGIKTLCFYMIAFNNRILPDDKKTLRLMHDAGSSYISLHRYYDYMDGEIVKQKMLEPPKRKMDQVDRIILINIIIYYFHPVRLTRFLFKEFRHGIIRRGVFFLKFLLGTK
jgi:anaerobic magnesium-protoporphyrin IX monomethyl ester cyclase